MLSLQAIELAPELQATERNQILIIGSVTLALYKDLAGIPASQQHIHIDDLDLSVPESVFKSLDRAAKNKPDTLPDEDSWVRNGYHGVHTVRRNFVVPQLNRPVQLDIGTGANGWSHKELRDSALAYDGYSVINPHKQLAWYEALDRKKDQTKIRILRTAIIPALDRLTERGGSE